ncbi:Gamma-tubulin complex component 5 [Balamuthia mandrillaris]
MLASSEESERHDEPKHSNTLAFFHPSLLLESCLLPSLSLRYDAAHSALLKLLTEKYKLWDHMLRLRLAFFMQDASFCRELVPHLLQQLNDGDTITFGDQFELNLLLQDMLALYSTSFKLSSSLSVGGVEASLSLQLSNIRSHRLDDLRLRYNAPWPISLLLDNEVQEKYNKVWLLLLQIQKAKYGLDIVLRQLSFSGCTKGAAHHLHLLRAKMLHFVNSFQDYIMNRALEAVWVEYKPLFTKARTLDEILALHQRFLAKITDRCLLTERAASVMAAIKKALDVTGAFKRLSSASPASASVEGRQMNATRSLHELGDVFHQRVQLLCTVLQGVVKQQKSPHLEDLLMRLDFNGHYTSTRS